MQIYLNLAGRDPVVTGLSQVAAGDATTTVASIKAAFLALADPNDWTGDGNPEGWQVIDRAFTKAEARYIPNGPDSTADMSFPTRTGDLVVFSKVAVPVRRGHAGDARRGVRTSSASTATCRTSGPPRQHQHAGHVHRGRRRDPQGQRHGADDRPGSDPGLPASTCPSPQQSQGRILLEMLDARRSVTPLSIVGLNDFHGQLDQTTMSIDGQNVTVGGAAQLATMFDEEAAALPGPAYLLAAGDNVGASPANSGLLQDKPAIKVENAWGLDATSYGNHEFDYGVARLLEHQALANFPFLAVNIVETATGKRPSWVKPSVVFTINGVKVGVIGAELENTPELVSAGATAGLTFLPEAERIRAESARLRRKGVRVQLLLIHQGTANGANAIDGKPSVPWNGPIVDIVNQLQDTTIDAVIAGHTHRVTNTMVGHIPVVEGINAGATYSVLQLMVKGGDVQYVAANTRVAKNLGVAARADVKAIVDDANAQTAVLRNQVIGTQQFDIMRAPSRLFESAMGNLVADAMRAKYPGVDAAITNSGGLRADLVCTPPSAGEAACEITWGEMFAVLPFGNRTVIETLTGDAAGTGIPQRLLAQVQPGDRDGPLPADLRPEGPVPLQRPAARGGRHVEGAERRERHADADRPGRHGPLRHERLHVHGRRRLHRLRPGHERPPAGR